MSKKNKNGWDESYQVQIWPEEMNRATIDQAIDDIQAALGERWKTAPKSKQRQLARLGVYVKDIKVELADLTYAELAYHEGMGLDICKLPRFIAVNRIMLGFISRKYPKLLPFLMTTEMPRDGFVWTDFNIHKAEK